MGRYVLRATRDRRALPARGIGVPALDVALLFDSEDPVFRRGVEVGIFWNRVTTWLNVRELSHAVCGDDSMPAFPPLTALIDGDCAEVVMKIAETCNLDFTARPVDGDLLEVTLKAKK
jgi:hypothetical protein